MGFWSNWIGQRNEIERLTKELSFESRKTVELSNLLDREEKRNALLETALSKEYSDHKKTLRRVADNASKQLSLPQGYLKDGDEPKSVIPPPPDEDTTVPAMVLWQSKVQRDADIADGIVPLPLEEYVRIISEAPTKYMLG